MLLTKFIYYADQPWFEFSRCRILLAMTYVLAFLKIYKPHFIIITADIFGDEMVQAIAKRLPVFIEKYSKARTLPTFSVSFAI